MSTATEDKVADLRDKLSHCEAMAANAVANHDITRQAVWGCQARKLRAEIKSLEPAGPDGYKPGDRVVQWPRGQVVDVAYGVVTTVYPRVVFVRFDGDSHSKACDPADLKPVQ